MPERQRPDPQQAAVWSHTLHQATGPSRKQEHDQNERKPCGARFRSGIILDLNHIERKEKHPTAERGVKKESEQVCTDEIARTEQSEGEDRIPRTRFDPNE